MPTGAHPAARVSLLEVNTLAECGSIAVEQSDTVDLARNGQMRRSQPSNRLGFSSELFGEVSVEPESCQPVDERPSRRPLRQALEVGILRSIEHRRAVRNLAATRSGSLVLYSSGRYMTSKWARFDTAKRT